MISTILNNFDSSSLFFEENLSCVRSYLEINDLNFTLHLLDLSQYTLLSADYDDKERLAAFLLDFINQTEEIDNVSDENISTIYHYSVPNIKLSYPEPFIASPSFMHSDIWFVHILLFQYWLWFMFIFIIVFFFITFICTVRWCNMRVRPRRETRGVSRSKCGDLITACVPVSWATSIIIHESTDAIDYFDGFGTTEMVVGIRAYQWGWEYYYPKDLDLNYNIKQNYSTFVGNSLKYSSTSDINLSSNNLWKFYQNKNTDAVVTPAHILLLPMDNYKFLNFHSFNDIGANPLSESNAFKRIRSFSKTDFSNLTHLPSNYSNKYKNFSNLFLNDNIYSESLYYGLKRQHNFINSSAVAYNFLTFFNLNSAEKWLNFNLKYNYRHSEFFNYDNKLSFNTPQLSLKFGDYFKFLNNNLIFSKSYFFKNFSTFFLSPEIFNSINNDSDKKYLKSPFLKMNSIFENKKFLNSSLLQNINSLHDFSSSFDFISDNDNSNKTLLFKTYAPFSPNQSMLFIDKTLRNFADVKPNSNFFNFNSQINSLNDYLGKVKNNMHPSSNYFYNLSSHNWLNLNLFNKLASSKIIFDAPISPIFSNNFAQNKWNFDLNDESATYIYSGKEDQTPFSIATAYWNFYWIGTDHSWRIFNNLNYHLLHDKFYLPFFSFYYDYDFRNWQTLAMLEDAYWESIYSIYTFDDYLNIVEEFNEYQYADKDANFYNKFDRFFRFKDNAPLVPMFKDLKSTGDVYANYIYLDDVASPTYFVNTNNYFLFPLINSQYNWDETYDSKKFFTYLYYFNNKSLFLTNSMFFKPHTLSYVYDLFRDDFDDFSFFLDEKNFDNFSFLFSADNLDKLNVFNDLFLFTDFDYDFLNFNTFRFSNQISLRNSVKNSIVTYNAIQKVFRARFDEGRSNAKLLDFANFYTKQPFLTVERPDFETFLGKNKENFIKINFYKSSFFNSFNDYYSTFSNVNFYFFDFPFLMAQKSDASRYLWFDWFAKWGFYEVQPSSSSRYAIYGMPYFGKNFEFNSNFGEILNETETYFLRLAKARRNYLPNWTYTPYFFAKSLLWNSNNIIFEIFNNSDNSIESTHLTLSLMDWFWKKNFFFNYSNYLYLPTHSNLTLYSRSSWQPKSSIQSYYFNVSSFLDILSKREFLYRQYFQDNNKTPHLPLSLIATPENPLLKEIKAAFLFADPINLASEYSREVYYSSLEFFNFNLLKALNSSISDFFNLSIFSNFILFYLFDSDVRKDLSNNELLFKSQYRPLRKGISNMIRLHATGAVALPIEIRLQILASSKDVIHSWAIPSAGIKIDCVPGYSSHKVAIFLVSGIFWGQCMEVCGRYHHWMPIVVYFMKRDLFFLWCTHFVFLSGANNMWSINDRQFTDYSRQLSYDKLSWISELN